LLLLTVFLNLF